MGSAVVFRLATPPDKVPMPSDVAPLVNVTVPVGVPELEVTVAVSVTLEPLVALVGAVSAVVVAAPFTVKVPLVIVTV